MNTYGRLDESGSSRSHVDRVALCDEVDDALLRDGVVVLCAPWGYGKTTLMGDYARFARRRSDRPVVRIDYADPDVLSYLSGSSTELERSLREAAWRHARRAGEQEGPAAGEGEAPLPARRKAGRRPAFFDMPHRYAFIPSRCAYMHLRYLAPDWCARVEAGARREEIRLGIRPVVTVDNLPHLDPAALEDLLGAFWSWAAAGASVVIACEPSCGVTPERLPRAHFMGPDVLGVSGSELAAWVRKLSIPRELDVAGATNGVPLLVAACRRVRARTLEQDEGFLRSCEQVVDHMLREPLSAVASSARRAMVIMGRGTLGDVAAAGALAKPHEFEELASWYPMLGIDLDRGTFRCIPTSCGAGFCSVRECASSPDRLGMQCVAHMLQKGNRARAAAVAGFLPDDDLAVLLDARSEELADLLDAHVIDRALDAVRAQRGSLAGKAGLSGLADFLAACADGLGTHGAGRRPEFVERLEAVLGFWYRHPAPAGAAACEGPCGQAVVELGLAALVQDGPGFRRSFEALCGCLEERDDGLGAMVLRCHAVVCGTVCGEAAGVVAWLVPHAERLRSRRVDPDVPCGLADALSSLVGALAGMVLERPGSTSSARSLLDQIRAAGRYLEARRVEPAASLARTVEALYLMWHGEEAAAADLLGRNVARWASLGFVAGQCLARIGLAYCSLAANRPGHAANQARTALGLAQRSGCCGLERLARLALMVALIRTKEVRELGEHDMRSSIEYSAIVPGICPSVWLAVAVVQLNEGNVELAGQLLRAVALRSGAFGSRLAVCTVRAFGNEKARLLEHLPRELRRDYLAVRSLSRRSMEAGDEGRSSSHLEDPDRGLSVRVFGAMGAAINGEPIKEGQWGRRKGLDILCLLALAPGQRMDREDLAALVHPSSETCRQKANALSTTLNCLRKAVGQTEGGPEYLTGCRGSIGLNGVLVDTDVARFERAARDVLAQLDDTPFEDAVERCAAVGKLYKNGPDEALYRYGGLPARRIDELRVLFGDVMLAGYDLAMGRGEFDLALRFSARAQSVDRSRPDVAAAAEAAMKAKRALPGRPCEAEEAPRAAARAEACGLPGTL